MKIVNRVPSGAKRLTTRIDSSKQHDVCAYETATSYYYRVVTRSHWYSDPSRFVLKGNKRGDVVGTVNNMLRDLEDYGSLDHYID